MGIIKLDPETMEIKKILIDNGISFSSFVRKLLKTNGKTWLIKHGYYNKKQKITDVVEQVEPVIKINKTINLAEPIIETKKTEDAVQS